MYSQRDRCLLPKICVLMLFSKFNVGAICCFSVALLECLSIMFEYLVSMSCFIVLLHYMIYPNLDHVSKLIVVYLKWPRRRREQKLLGFNVGPICCFTVVLFEWLNIIFFISCYDVLFPGHGIQHDLNKVRSCLRNHRCVSQMASPEARRKKT